jgi:hypothetical protein
MLAAVLNKQEAGIAATTATLAKQTTAEQAACETMQNLKICSSPPCFVFVCESPFVCVSPSTRCEWLLHDLKVPPSVAASNEPIGK